MNNSLEHLHTSVSESQTSFQLHDELIALGFRTWAAGCQSMFTYHLWDSGSKIPAGRYKKKKKWGREREKREVDGKTSATCETREKWLSGTEFIENYVKLISCMSILLHFMNFLFLWSAEK